MGASSPTNFRHGSWYNFQKCCGGRQRQQYTRAPTQHAWYRPAGNLVGFAGMGVNRPANYAEIMSKLTEA